MSNEKQLPVWLRLTYSLILSLFFMTFGVLEFMSAFEATEEWSLYVETEFLGWTGEFMTGIAMVIFGLVIFWSTTLYLRKKEQKGNAFLMIGSGVGVVFGAIFVLIVVADVIAVLVDTVAEAAAPDFAGAITFYHPIILAFFSVPIFVLLFSQHRKIKQERALTAS